VARTKGIGKVLFFCLIVFVVILLDQVAKFFVSKFLVVGDCVFSFPGFCLTYSENFGAGFSILQGHVWLFVFVALFFLALIFFNFSKLPKENYVQLGFALFVGGTFSNLLDRLFRGFVVDYFDLRFLGFSNNLADITLSVGAVLIAYYLFFGKKKVVNKKLSKK
jgi:signal peptidase II